MKYTKTVEIAAAPAKVWAALVDVENWPVWTKSMEKVERLDREKPFGLGSQARISQPKFYPLVWTVTEFTPGVSFAWEATTRTVLTNADHKIETLPNGNSRVTLSIRQSGLLAFLV